MSEQTDPAAKVYSRLNRARKLHQELDRAISNYEEFKVGSSKTYSNLTGRTELKLDIPPMPREWGFLASEILHHTRSSLDNSLIAAVERTNPNSIQRWKQSFPLSDSNSHFNSYALNRNLKGVSAELVELVRTLQPFSFVGSLSDSLKSLATLNNADKHSSLSVVGTVFLDQLNISEIKVGFTDQNVKGTLNGHGATQGKLAHGHTILSVDTQMPFREAHFQSVVFTEEVLRFETVLEALPSFNVDDFALAIDDVEQVCRTLCSFSLEP